MKLRINAGLSKEELLKLRLEEEYYDTSINKYPSLRDYSLLNNPEYLSYMENINPYEMKTYSNNPYFKDACYNEEMTEWEICEFQKCANNFWYFVENYLKIRTNDFDTVLAKPFDFQKNIINSVIQNTHNIIMLGRQQGKTSTMCMYITWFILFQRNRKVYLFGSTLAISTENLSKVYEIIGETPFFLQSGFIKKNERSLTLANGSSIKALPSSEKLRGFTPNLILWDEAAFTPNDENFYTSIVNSLSSGKGKNTKMCVVSTPNGLGNTFARLWFGALEEKNEYKAVTAKWNDNPLKDESWLLLQKRTMTDVKFKQEVLCTFLGSSNTLIDGNYLEDIREDILEPVFQNETYKIFEHPEPNNQYVLTVDVAEGVGLDYSVVNVINVSQRPFKQVAVYRDNKITPLQFSKTILDIALKFNKGYILVENNSKGSVVCNAIYGDFQYEHFFCEDYNNKENKYGLRVTKAVKEKGCIFLKDLIETRSLLIRDIETLEELYRFEKQLNNSYKGANNSHDDIVMTLVSFGWFSDHLEFRGVSDVNLKYEIVGRRLESGNEDRIPPPVLGNYFSNEPNNRMLDLYDLINSKTKIYNSSFEEAPMNYFNYMNDDFLKF